MSNIDVDAAIEKALRLSEAEDRDHNLSGLISKFKDYYNKFETHWANFSNNPNQLNYMMLGRTGAGKSTFVARLVSQMSPEEFYSDIIQREDNMQGELVDVDGIVIGSTNQSVTVVPRYRMINAIRRQGPACVIDVPGFMDADPNINQIVQLLRKCLLTRVAVDKYIVVIPLKEVYDARTCALRDNYFQSMKELFGSNFTDVIRKNIFFVITHADEMTEEQRQPQAIRNRITRIITDSAPGVAGQQLVVIR